MAEAPVGPKHDIQERLHAIGHIPCNVLRGAIHHRLVRQELAADIIWWRFLGSEQMRAAVGWVPTQQ